MAYSWIETAPRIVALLPPIGDTDGFDWRGWCEYVQQFMPFDVYYDWHLYDQPYLFKAATHALYWPIGAVVSTRIEFHPNLLRAMEALGMEGQQRNYMANALCYHAYRLALIPVAFTQPSTCHMAEVTTFGPNTCAEILATILIGCERHLDSFCQVIGSYMRWGTNAEFVEWSGSIPLCYFTGTNERIDGPVHEHLISHGEEGIREAVKQLVRRGIYTRRARPKVRTQEVHTERDSSMLLQIRLEQKHWVSCDP